MLDSCCAGYGQLAGCCEHGSGIFGSMKGREFLYQLRNKKGSAAMSYLINEGQSSLCGSAAVVTNTDPCTYLLTPWSRVLLEKLTGSAASQEIHRIFGTRRFITVPTSARHLSLS